MSQFSLFSFLLQKTYLLAQTAAPAPRFTLIKAGRLVDAVRGGRVRFTDNQGILVEGQRIKSG
jgi:hypothetical protein